MRASRVLVGWLIAVYVVRARLWCVEPNACVVLIGTW